MTAGNSTIRSTKADDSAPVLIPFPSAELSSADLSAGGEIACDPSHQQSFLEDLEMRQDEVLHLLDDLDRRVVSLLDEYLQARQAS